MKRHIVVATALSLSACIPFPCHETPRIKVPLQGGVIDPTSDEKLQTGDIVHAVTPTGAIDEFEVVAVEETGFVGTAWDHKRYNVLYRNLRSLFVERPKWTVCVAHN